MRSASHLIHAPVEAIPSVTTSPPPLNPCYVPSAPPRNCVTVDATNTAEPRHRYYDKALQCHLRHHRTASPRNYVTVAPPDTTASVTAHQPPWAQAPATRTSANHPSWTHQPQPRTTAHQNQHTAQLHQLPPSQLRRETYNEMFWKNRVIHDQTGHRMIQPINRTFSRRTQHLSSTTSEGDLSKTRLVLGGSVRDLTLHYYYYKTQRSPKGGDSSTTTICAPTTLTTLTRSLLDFIIKQILLCF